MNSLQGHLLIASPHLSDGNFFRSVVLMIQHDDEGAVGLVLNRPSHSSIGDIWGEISDEPSDCPQPINMGGPVVGPLMALHVQADCSESEVLPGVYLATQKDHLNQIIRKMDEAFLLFSGYSGWGSGQLEEELEAGGWITSEATRQDVFYDQHDLWNRVAQRIGLEIILPSVNKACLPEDPEMN